MKFKSVFVFYCLSMGILIGIFSALFLSLVNFLIHSVWHTIPSYLNLPFYPLLVGLLGGLLIGLFQTKVGDYPKTMHDTLAEFKDNNKVTYTNYQIIKNFFSALIVLAFGASLGPEAALASLLGSMISWLGDRMKWTLARKEELVNLGTAAILSIIFRAPFAGLSEPLEEQYEQKSFRFNWKKLLLYGLTTASGILSFSLTSQLFPKEAVFTLRFPKVEWTREVFLLIIPALVLGFLFGHLFLIIETVTKEIAKKIEKPLILTLIAGLFIGIFAMLSPYFLYSGEHEILSFSKEASQMGTLSLLSIAIGKALLTNICFSFKWRGGKIFPAIFSSASAGFVLANLFPYTPALTIGVVVAASVTTIMKQPLVVAALLLFLFPIQFFPFILFTCLLISSLSSYLTKDKSMV
ncbi:MAG: chloride channel protein [Lactovum sp.]